MTKFTKDNWESMCQRVIINDEGQRIKHRIEEKIRRFTKKTEKRKKEYQLFETLWKNEIIIGLLLSDAHLRSIKDGQNSCFVLDIQERDKEIINLVVEFFSDLGIGSCVDRQLHNGKHWSIRITTYRNYAFTLLRKLWYPEEKKIVPKTVKLTPKSVAYWFMGDGSSYWKKHSIKKSYITFFTDGFQQVDVLKLKKSLEKNIGINGINIRKLKTPRKGYRIELSQSYEVEKLMILMEPHMLKCFKYKIKIPFARNRSELVPKWVIEKL